MASICGKISQDFDFSCENGSTKYYQKVVIINVDDIDTSTIIKTKTATEHHVEFSLKATKKGYSIEMPVAGRSIFGSYSMARNEVTRSPQYTHIVNFAMVGLSELVKAYIRQLDKGSYIVAAKPMGENIVEIYGIDNGLSNADYTYDPTNNNGAGVLVLQSVEGSPENDVPFVYKSADPMLDFDENFLA